MIKILLAITLIEGMILGPFQTKSSFDEDIYSIFFYYNELLSLAIYPCKRETANVVLQNYICNLFHQNHFANLYVFQY